MEHLNVQGLPEPIVPGLEVIVEIARKLTGRKPPPPRRQRIALNVRKGTVYGKLTREIYDAISPPLAMLDTNVLVYAYYEDAPQ
jgi:hypothetical protein